MKRSALLAVCLAAGLTAAAAQEITGVVTNRTTGRPASGAEVVLLRLAQGMDEVARTRTDARGEFTLKVEDTATPHLVRVNHGAVNYHRPAPPGTQSVEVDVYDSAAKVTGVRMTINIMRVEANIGEMQVTQLFILENASAPPRTWMGARTLEFALPSGAKLQQAVAAGPGGMSVTSAPVPTGEKDRYAFLFPVRPGESRFQIAYTMPYSGSATVAPVLLEETGNLAVAAAPGIELSPAPGSRLEPKTEESGMRVIVADSARPGQNLAFRVSGVGTVPQNTGAAGEETAESRGPGGGIGVPIGTPDPLDKYKWWILSGIGLLLVAGAAWSMKRPVVPAPSGETVSAAAPLTPAATSSEKAAVLNDAIKDQLFELEKDRLQGRITEEEYAQAKLALERLLRSTMQ